MSGYVLDGERFEDDEWITPPPPPKPDCDIDGGTALCFAVALAGFAAGFALVAHLARLVLRAVHGIDVR